MDNISISIPNEPRAIAAAAEFFRSLREDVKETFEPKVKSGIAGPATVGELVIDSAPCGVDSTSIDPEPQAPESVPDPVDVFAFPPRPPVVVGDGNEPEYVAPVTPGVALDSAGIPWDARIHSSSRAFVADGTWRLRRNLDPNILASVKAELGQAMGAPAAVPPPPAAPAPAWVPAPPIVQSAPVGLTFPGLLQKITAAGITKEQATAAATKLGLPSFALVATRPDLLPAMAAELGVA